MGMMDVVEEHVGSLLAFALVTGSEVLSTAKSVVLTVRGDEDADGHEELDQSEVFGQAPLMYRPQDADDDGQMEAMVVRYGDERIVIGTKDRRFQIEPAKGEAIVSALGKDGTAQAALRLQADGTVIIEADSIKLGGDGVSDFVALASQVKARLDTIQAAYDGHKHTETGGTTAVPDTIIGSLSGVASGYVESD